MDGNDWTTDGCLEKDSETQKEATPSTVSVTQFPRGVGRREQKPHSPSQETLVRRDGHVSPQDKPTALISLTPNCRFW